MKRLPIVIAPTFAVGFIAGLVTISGCSEVATRTLNIVQNQSTHTYTGRFHFDTSQLPPDAVEKLSETGKPGAPITQLKLKSDYEVEVVLRLVNADKGAQPTPDAADPKKLDEKPIDR